ncbi:MAG: hypothetical protein IPK14_19035 [Blastocatellia bacterium]|nr:hypothetical protein [Blastocatellia bacterium]MBL8195061.1 hypothetical protein [Blastocatellia bacterium]
MDEKIKKILFRDKKVEENFEASKNSTNEQQLIIHKTTTAQRCEICHQSDMFNIETGECRRCGNIPVAKIQTQPTNEIQPTGLSTRLVLITTTIMFVVGSLIYSLLVAGRLDQTAALFIGLPAVLAILTTFIRKQKTFTGAILKGMTFTLLLTCIFSTVVLGDGVICIVMAIPVFYAVGSVIGAILDIVTKNSKNRSKGPLPALILLPFLIMSLEGINSNLSFSRDEIVVVEKIIPTDQLTVAKSLSMTPKFNKELPFYLKLQFPRPVRTSGSGLAFGDQRIIHFAGGEGKPGDLILSVKESQIYNSIDTVSFVKFGVVSDKSAIAHWLAWQESTIEWQSIDSTNTKVRWTIKYQRLLDPAWYFGPWERYAVGLSAEYLIDNLTNL